jgi:dTMP kinase
VSYKNKKPMHRPNGRFIVFEGVEGAGKSTQLNRLQRWLTESGWVDVLSKDLKSGTPPIWITREPGGTILGKQLRQLLLDSALTAAEGLPDVTELLLYAADRAQHVHAALRPALAEGTLVLCDRYTDSTVAYQGYGRGLALPLIQQLNAIATGGLKSDLTLWLDLDVREGLSRARARQADGTALQGTDRMEATELTFHERVQQGFAALAQAEPQRLVRVEASGSEDRVAEQVQTIVEQRLNQWYPQLLPH